MHISAHGSTLVMLGAIYDKVMCFRNSAIGHTRLLKLIMTKTSYGAFFSLLHNIIYNEIRQIIGLHIASNSHHALFILFYPIIDMEICQLSGIHHVNITFFHSLLIVSCMAYYIKIRRYGVT